MSRYLSSAAKTEFDNEVKHAYQISGEGLRNTVTLRTGVVGDTYKFRKMGKGIANQKASAALVTPMDITHTLITVTLDNWNAPEYTDIFDAQEVNFEEQKELAYTIANALRRREDQIIIAALDAATSLAGTVTEDIGGTNSGLNPEKVRRGMRYLDAEGVPGSDRHWLFRAEDKETLLAETEVTSSDYNTVKALVNGEINSWCGFMFHLIETRDEGGLPAGSSSEHMNFAYHKDAVGLAIGIDIKTEVNYIAERTSWLANGMLKAGAGVRDTKGVVDIQVQDAV
jgi:hypothetical protein